MNKEKIEQLIVVRDASGKIIAISNRIEGEQKYEILMTTTASVEDLIELLNDKDPFPKVEKPK
jgi:hypothetical protein